MQVLRGISAAFDRLFPSLFRSVPESSKEIALIFTFWATIPPSASSSSLRMPTTLHAYDFIYVTLEIPVLLENQMFQKSDAGNSAVSHFGRADTKGSGALTVI